MKRIAKNLIYLSCLCFGFLDAKSLTITFDHTTQEEQYLDASHHCRKLTIENKGTGAVKNFFPYVNENPYLTLESIAAKIGSDPNPVLALYALCKNRLAYSHPFINPDYSPLDDLNFCGSCRETEFAAKFTNLCHLLGIDTRSAGLNDRDGFDFCWDEDQWTYLNVKTGQFYLGFDNKTALSSDELRDDPLLILRAKFDRLNGEMDFAKSWNEFAKLNVIEPQVSGTDEASAIAAEAKPLGFDLYRAEKLVFHTPESHLNLQPHQSRVDHYVNMNYRHLGGSIVYHSPLPIREISNQTDSMVYARNLDLYIRPKSVVTITEPLVFTLDLDASPDCSGCFIVSSICSSKLFPALEAGVKNAIYLGTEENSSLVDFIYDEIVTADINQKAVIAVENRKGDFGYQTPCFTVNADVNHPIDFIHWQISKNPDFREIPSNLEGIIPFQTEVNLDPVSETFLNPDEPYYFRAKGKQNDSWGSWSAPVSFTTKKPLSVELVEFEKIGTRSYEINWEREAEDSNELIEYLVFGSNAYDFVPSIYTASQVNEIIDGTVTEQSLNNNLVAVTIEPKIVVDGTLAYYRIVAKQNGQLSVPSPLIHVFDHDLIYPRNVLRLENLGGDQQIAKRVLIPPTYSWTEIALPRLSQKNKVYENSLLQIRSILEKRASLESSSPTKGYVKPARVPQDVWDQVKPWFFPENHPCKMKIDRIFARSRATLSQESMRKAGFHGRTGRYTRVTASLHAECNDCFFKVFCDTELHLRMPDWQKWLHRIHGKNLVKECIAKYEFGKWFKVPHKWVYPLPEYPACPKSSRYIPKNFILICTNARLHDHETNKKLWKEKMTPPIMDALYVLLDECGMWDSVFPFNVPFCKTGYFTWVDTEYYHRWPVNFSKLTKAFSSKNRKYWEYLIRNHGPKWYTRGGEDGRKREKS